LSRRWDKTGREISLTGKKRRFRKNAIDRSKSGLPNRTKGTSYYIITTGRQGGKGLSEGSPPCGGRHTEELSLFLEDRAARQTEKRNSPSGRPGGSAGLVVWGKVIRKKKGENP